MTAADASTLTNASAEQMLEELVASLRTAEENVKQAQQKQQEYANQHRKDEEFEEGQQVLLSTSDLRLRSRITPKFSSAWIGPFTIKRKLSPLNYELELPSSLSIHPVFHISKLRQYQSSERFDVLRPSIADRPPPEIVGKEEQFEVEAIRDHRLAKWRGKMYKQYLVKWKGYPDYENTWEWEDSLTRAKRLVREYQRQKE